MKTTSTKIKFGYITILLLSMAFSNSVLAQPKSDGVWRYNSTLEDDDLSEVCPYDLIACECSNSYMENDAFSNAPSSTLINAVRGWMSYLDEDLYLSQISIPGTHDTGAEAPETVGVATQTWTILEQLRGGIRYFDIRVRENDAGTGWEVYHGSYCLELTFDEIYDDIELFLSGPGNEKETVIMSIQKEDYSSAGIPEWCGDGKTTNEHYSQIRNKIENDTVNYPLFDMYLSTPQLKDVRGKIVAFNNTSDRSRFKMDVQNKYTVYQWASDCTGDNPPCFICGENSSCATLPAKERIILEHIDEAAQSKNNLIDDKWFVTYISGAIGMTPACVAAHTNDVTFQHLNLKPSRTNVGTILMDYPGEGLIYRIIKTNFVYDKQIDLTVGIDCHYSLLVGGASDSNIKIKLYNGPYLLGETSHVAGCSGLGDSFYQFKTVVRAMPQEYTHFTVENTNPRRDDGLGIDEIYISRTKYGIGGIDFLVEDELIEKWGVDGGSLWCLGIEGDNEYGSDAPGNCRTMYAFYSGRNSAGYPGAGSAPAKYLEELNYYTQGCVAREDQAYSVKGTAVDPFDVVALCGVNAPPVIYEVSDTIAESYTLPTGVRMIVESGVVLTIPYGIILTLENEASLINYGTIVNLGRIIVKSKATVENKPDGVINSLGLYINYGKTLNEGEVYSPSGYYGRGQGGKQLSINPMTTAFLLGPDAEGGRYVCENFLKVAGVSKAGEWDSVSNTCSIESFWIEEGRQLVVDQGVTIVVNGILSNNGIIDNRGIINNLDGTINQCGIFEGTPPTVSPLECYVSEEAAVCRNLGGEWNEFSRTCNVNGTATIDEGTNLDIPFGITYYINGTLNNLGTINNSGNIVNFGTIFNDGVADIYNFGTITMDYEGESGFGSTLQNEGYVRNIGSFQNLFGFGNGGILGYGQFLNQCGGVFSGSLPAEGEFFDEEFPEFNPPKARAKDLLIVLDSTANDVSISPMDIDDGSFDACGIDSMLLSKAAFGCGDVGLNTVVLSVKDVSGNIGLDTFLVTVEDFYPPVILDQSRFFTLQLDSSGHASLSALDVDNGSSDNCGVVSLSLSQSEFDCSDVGSNNVTFTVTDGSGNTSSVDIVVVVEDVTRFVTVSHPTCDIQTGTIEVDIINATDVYSFDNGASFLPVNFVDRIEGGNYDVLIKNEDGCISIVNATIDAVPLIPDQPLIKFSGSGTDESLLYTDSTLFAYQWYKDGVEISGGTNDSIVVSEPGSYTVMTYSEDGCASDASIAQLIGPTGIYVDFNSLDIQFYPNPVNESFTVTFSGGQGKKIVTIYHLNGKQTDSQEVYGQKAEFNVNDYPAGFYLVKVVSGNMVRTSRFVKQ